MSGLWRVPAGLALLSLIGLAAAILGDGVWDGLSWAALSVPLAICMVKLWRQWPAGRAGQVNQ
ncbi:hypothetical protein AZL_d04430 (plasmid) [Azospirillum sp. B510]|uniref:hypothetical protein n=1 Tax=Azospirillum sp. (strain B510) TaxID=137722 RepID=UPI0001C4CE57|nr:hypothetical protein [Azospirillum sp. B510]BAI76269.1 hypothetical protein AZL_d04430 [Azospirillum sp. B510]